MNATQQANLRSFYLAIAVVALLGGGAVAFIALSAKDPIVTLEPGIEPSVSSGYVMGDHNAKIEIAEFGDFECIACGAWFDMNEIEVRDKLVKTGIARFRFYDFPLPSHANSLSAHVAAGCADAQQKFWEMHDLIYKGQGEWNAAATNNPKKIFSGYAKDIGLDTREWAKCYDERRPMPHILANAAEGQRLGVGSTPTFIIGNKLMVGGASFEKIKAFVDSALADTTSTPLPGRSGRGRGGDQ